MAPHSFGKGVPNNCFEHLCNPQRATNEAMTANIRLSQGDGPVQKRAEPGMAEPETHRDVSSRFLNGATILAHTPNQAVLQKVKPCHKAWTQPPQTPGISPSCRHPPPTPRRGHFPWHTPELPGKSAWNRTSGHTWSRSEPPSRSPWAGFRRGRHERCPGRGRG